MEEDEGGGWEEGGRRERKRVGGGWEEGGEEGGRRWEEGGRKERRGGWEEEGEEGERRVGGGGGRGGIYCAGKDTVLFSQLWTSPPL